MSESENVEKAQVIVKKAPWIWFRNEIGEKSASLTLAVIAFLVCTIWVAASIIESVGTFQIRAFDPAVVAAYLAPCLGLYGFRRHTKSSTETNTSNSDSSISD